MWTRTRSRLWAAVAVALVSALGSGVVVERWVSSDARAPIPLGLRATRAGAPFAGYREVRVAIDDRCVRVVVADTPARRERGLRGVDDLRPYEGMLFAERGDNDAGFTMAGVSSPLDITWYAPAGFRVDATQMRPCPNADAAHCPVYRSQRPYRFALESPAGTLSSAPLAPCG